jgi:heme A synthase
MSLKEEDTTRYLCAAAHLDWELRTQVINQVLEEEHKAIGLSFGVNLIALLKQCLAARRRKRIRDLSLALLLLLGLFVVISSENPWSIVP